MKSDSHPYKAFVSSTFEDLKDHRAYVIRQLRRAGFFVDPMEDWTADSDEPKNFSQDRLSGCDLCVVLVAFRRGYVPDGEMRSITQLEYDAAVKQGVDILPFLLEENAPWPRRFDELDKDSELKKWRNHLGDKHGREVFTLDPRSIDLTGALGRWFAKKNGGKTEPEKITRIDWPKDESPYPGLEWFDEKYAPLFFGRDREVEELVNKLSEPGGRFLIISGPSGSGKSSLVAAGLWQALMKEGRLPASQHWRWLRITPGADSRGPFVSLAAGLQHIFPKGTARAGDLAVTLASDPGAFSKHIIPQLSHGQELVLFVDQLEELFTQGYPSAEIQSFLTHLVTLTADLQNRLRVVATIRSEFFGRLAESEPVRLKINDGFQVLIGPISLKALEEMIEQPAAATGYTFEPQLVETILDDTGKEPGNLPLAAYALKQLFEQRQGRAFTRAVYDAMKGVAGAIGTKADQVMETLGQKAGASFNRVFAELVHIDRDRPPTRKRASLSHFKGDEEAVKVIRVFAGPDCRVLVIAGEGQNATVEVAHEKLFSAWPRLKGWIDESGEALRLIDHATEAAERWEENGGNLQKLGYGTDAKEVLEALQRFGKHPSPVLSRFLKPQHLLIGELSDPALSHERRALYGRILSEFGDRRPGVALRADGLPDIVWIEILGGPVKLEDIDHVFEVEPFCIAKYPVTNEQFGAFFKAEDGYRNEEWWKDIEQSHEASAPRWQEANSPRETVSWYEAIAFCRWFSAKTGTGIRLPTEWEWQQAATGGDPQREYPWEGGWDVSRCNNYESRLSRTTAVGMYSQGATQQGVLDMAGNVWEWCLNDYEKPERPEAVCIDNKGGWRVHRGGSWSGYFPGYLRVSFRFRGDAGDRGSGIGFRLAQDLEP